MSLLQDSLFVFIYNSLFCVDIFLFNSENTIDVSLNVVIKASV